jgi:hypothetical protein
MKNNVLDTNYSMLLGHEWLRDAKVTHDWGNNLISIEDNGTIHTIAITKHLDSNIKRPKVLLCYDFINGVTNEEEDMLLVAKLDLFTIGTINLLKLKVLVVMCDAKTNIDAKIDTNAKIDINEKTSTDAKIDTNVEIDTNTKIGIDLKISIDKPIFYFPHPPEEISVDTTPTWIKMQDMKMAKWNLAKDV